LPVFDVNDAWFQWIIESDTEIESDALCQINQEPIIVGLVENCGDGYKIQFTQKPTRYRVSPLRVLYVWEDGLPDFFNHFDVGECFHVMISKPTIDDQTWCSNCFQRIYDDCHTTVIEYTNNQNAFGFNYCAGEDLSADVGCAPTIIQFTNQSTLDIPYTAYLQSKYGTTPDVQAWIEDGGELVAAGIRIALNAFPPTNIHFDFGGNASGFVIIK